MMMTSQSSPQRLPAPTIARPAEPFIDHYAIDIACSQQALSDYYYQPTFTLTKTLKKMPITVQQHLMNNASGYIFPKVERQPIANGLVAKEGFMLITPALPDEGK